MRVRVRSAEGTERWIYSDRLDYAGGLGPTNWAPVKQMTSDGDFDTLRKDAVLLAGDDPELSKKLKAGAERILVLGGSPTGAWAAEDAIRHGVAGADLMGDVRLKKDRDAFPRGAQGSRGRPSKDG